MVLSKSNHQILDLLKLKDKKIEEIMKDILKYDIDQTYLAFMQAELTKMKKYSLHIH